MWVCRAGKNAKYIDYYLETSKIYMPWLGFDCDLSLLANRAEFRRIVAEEMETDNRTSISNWSGQLLSFCNEMELQDYVIIPHAFSHNYTLGRVTGKYAYSKFDKYGLHHSREIEIIKKVPREIFSQAMQYSLGAYRSLFRAKNEDMLLSRIMEYHE